MEDNSTLSSSIFGSVSSLDECQNGPGSLYSDSHDLAVEESILDLLETSSQKYPIPPVSSPGPMGAEVL